MELSIGLAHIVFGIFSNGVDWNDIVSGDSPFSDGQRQHDHCITEKGFGRQPKMKKNERKFVEGI